MSLISLRFKARGSQIQDSPAGHERAGALNSFMNTGQIIPCGKGSGLPDSISDSRSKKKIQAVVRLVCDRFYHCHKAYESLPLHYQSVRTTCLFALSGTEVHRTA